GGDASARQRAARPQALGQELSGESLERGFDHGEESTRKSWWAGTGLNRRHQDCQSATASSRRCSASGLSRLLFTSIGRYATPCCVLVLAWRNGGIGKVEGTVAGKVAASYSRRRLFWMLSAIASRPPAATTGDSALSIRNLTDSAGGAVLALEGRPPRPCR